MAESPYLLTGTNISKAYRGNTRTIQVLQAADFHFERGSFTAVIGRSGTGKTTLLKLCSGLDKPDSGEVTFDGQRLDEMSETQLAAFRNERVGFVFQNFFLREERTTLDNVMAPLLLGNRTISECRDRASQALKEVGLGDYIQTRAGQLSGGQKQRVAIARAVANHPALILADEPTGSLDIETGREILDLLFSYNKNHGATVIVVTHDPLVRSYNIPMITVKDGKIQTLEALPEVSG